jgi:hypothetical protein
MKHNSDKMTIAPTSSQPCSKPNVVGLGKNEILLRTKNKKATNRLAVKRYFETRTLREVIFTNRKIT